MINEGGDIQEYAYDPWGARRNPTNWNEKDSRTSWILNRGYTGHEHIDQFGIINMNGRVYDPLTAQFFSPDPVLQAPGNWTNYNRYTYCMNNPFKYTDPSGYIMVNDEEGNYHYDAGSGAYQSRFDQRGSVSYNWNSGQYEYANGEWAGLEALKNQLYSTNSYDCTYKGEKLEEIRDYMKDGYQMHHTNFYGRRGVVFSKGDPGIVTSDAGVIFINNMAYYLEGQRMAGSINGNPQGQGAYSGNNIFFETWSHYQMGGRKDLNVSTSSLDLSFVSKKNLSYNSKNNTYSVNLFSLNKFSQTSLALGKVSLNSIGNNRYTINRDYYDFNIEWDQGFSTRNIGTFAAGLMHGPVIDNIPVSLPTFPFFGPSVYTGSGPYWINFSGSVYIKP